MVWDQLEPTPAHLTYLLLSTFLISYVLFVRFFRNRREFREAVVNEWCIHGSYTADTCALHQYT
jgi:hypothetical protein